MCVDVDGHVFISFCKQMGLTICVFSKCVSSDIKGRDKDRKGKKEV